MGSGSTRDWKTILKKTIIDSIHDSSTNLSEVSNSFFSLGGGFGVAIFVLK